MWDFYIIQYLSRDPRTLEYFTVGGADWGSHYRNEAVGQLPSQGQQPLKAVEVLHTQFSCPAACPSPAGSSQGSGDAQSLRAREGQKGRKRPKRQQESIYDYLRENPVLSLTSIVRTPKWLADPLFRFIRLDDKRLQRAIQVFNDEMCTYSTLDFTQLCITIPSHFSMLRTKTCTAFMTVKDSFAAMLAMLDFQFDSSQQEVSEFVNNLYALVEKLIPKVISTP